MDLSKQKSCDTDQSRRNKNTFILEEIKKIFWIIRVYFLRQNCQIHRLIDLSQQQQIKLE